MRHHFARFTLLLVAAAALGAASPAAAAGRPRVVVFAVRGDNGPALAGQLSRALCSEFECVAASRVKRGGKLDFNMVRAQRVDGVLFGTSTKKGRGRRLQMALLTTSFRPDRTWSLPVEANRRLSGQTLAGFSSDLRDSLGGGGGGAAAAPPVATRAAPAPRPAPAPMAAPAFPPAPAPAAEAPMSDSPAGELDEPADGGEPAARAPASIDSPAPARTASRPPPSPRNLDEPSVEAPSRAGGRYVAADLGFAISKRDLAYSGTDAGSGAPLKVSAPGIVSPALYVEVLPLGGSDGWYRGLMLFGSYAFSMGLKTEEPGGTGRTFDTSATQLELGGGFRIWPISSSRLSLTPHVSYRTFSVKLKEAGAIKDLPDADLAGTRFGLDLEAPVVGRFAVLAGLGYTVWFRAGQLIGDYFSAGTVWSVDGSVGLSVGVYGPVSVRALLDYSRTTYTFTGTSSYSATGAIDTLLGGRVLARLEF